MNTVLVGLSPGRTGGEPLDPARPNGSRLADLAGVGVGQFRTLYDRINLYSILPCPPESADEGAARNLRPILRSRRVIALGKRMAAALEVAGPQFRWAVRDGFVGAAMPHPSGLNRWWNDEKNREAARRFMQSSLRPCVHLEGTDGSGKTTLSDDLAWSSLSLERVGTEDPPGSWGECLDRIDSRVRPGIVCDRSSGLVSELVYGPVVRGATVIPEDQIWRIASCLVHAVEFIYCRPPADEIRPSFRDGEDEEHVSRVVAKSGELLARYDTVMGRLSSMGARVIYYDWTRQKPGEVIQCAGR